jgi:ERF superfamily
MTERNLSAEDRHALLFSALVAAQEEFPPIARSRTVRVATRGGGSYSFAYAPLDAILAVVRPALVEQGLTVSQGLTSTESGAPALRTTLAHKAGGSIEDVFPLTAMGGSVASGQDLGKLVTYVRRYALAAILGVATEQDDDTGETQGASDRPEARVEGPQDEAPPRNWPEVRLRLSRALGGGDFGAQTGEAFLTQAIAEMYPDGPKPGAERTTARQRCSAAVVALEEAIDHREFPPPSRKEVQAAFASVLEGKELPGPEWRMTADETDRPEHGAGTPESDPDERGRGEEEAYG